MESSNYNDGTNKEELGKEMSKSPRTGLETIKKTLETPRAIQSDINANKLLNNLPHLSRTPSNPHGPKNHLGKMKNFKLALIVLSSAWIGTAFGAATHCQELFAKRNINTECQLPTSGYSAGYTRDCFNQKLPVGTEVRYNCVKHHSTQEGDFVGGYMICNPFGKWTRYKSYTEFQCFIECGRREQGSDESPWQASLFVFNNETRRYGYFCGGTLINPSGKGFRVLTSAKCLFEPNSDRLRPISHFSVALGATQTRYEEITPTNRFSIKKSIVYPHYNPVDLADGDIGFIELNEKVTVSDAVRPVCFPNRGNTHISSKQVQPGVTGEIQLFTDENGIREAPKKVVLPILREDSCEDTLGTRPFPSQLCAGHYSNPALCDGDLGSGLVVNDFSGVPKKYFVQGVMSRGREGSCQNYRYFSKVMEYAAWIHSALDESSEPDEENRDFTTGRYSPIPEYEYSPVVPSTPPSTTQTTTRTTTRTTTPTTTTRSTTIPSRNTHYNSPLHQSPAEFFPAKSIPTTEKNDVVKKPEGTTKKPYQIVSTTPRFRITKIPLVERTTTARIVPTTKRNPPPAPLAIKQEKTTTLGPISDGGDFRKMTLDVHNAYRAKHGVSPYILSEKLNEEAQSWADYLIRENKKYLSRSTAFGKNLFEAKGYNLSDPDFAKLAVDNWYNTKKEYNWGEPLASRSSGSIKKWLSFTQVVWKSSTEIGVGLARKGGPLERTVFVVAYAPAGNILGENSKYFKENVLPNVDY